MSGDYVVIRAAATFPKVMMPRGWDGTVMHRRDLGVVPFTGHEAVRMTVGNLVPTGRYEQRTISKVRQDVEIWEIRPFGKTVWDNEKETLW